MKIGCIGQGWVGKNIADNFERRNYVVVRYALDPEYVLNRKHINEADVVFIAVPTPTTPDGFDYSIVEEMVSLVGDGKIAIIKSTLLPGTLKKIQDTYPNKVVLFSPEFLCESTAMYDVSNPMFNIIGLAYDSAGHRSAAEEVMRILPRSKHNFIVRGEAAELFKYAHNINGFMRVVFSNLLHDVADKIGADWADVKLIMDNDPMMSPYYNSPVHKGGRGAGGSCFIKDMAAFSRLYAELNTDDILGIDVLRALERKNLELLALTGKSQDLVEGVYGKKESKI
jgi:UDPglucose 6-dehydrogenase